MNIAPTLMHFVITVHPVVDTCGKKRTPSTPTIHPHWLKTYTLVQSMFSPDLTMGTRSVFWKSEKCPRFWFMGHLMLFLLHLKSVVISFVYLIFHIIYMFSEQCPTFASLATGTSGDLPSQYDSCSSIWNLTMRIGGDCDCDNKRLQWFCWISSWKLFWWGCRKISLWG